MGEKKYRFYQKWKNADFALLLKSVINFLWFYYLSSRLSSQRNEVLSSVFHEKSFAGQITTNTRDHFRYRQSVNKNMTVSKKLFIFRKKSIMLIVKDAFFSPRNTVDILRISTSGNFKTSWNIVETDDVCHNDNRLLHDHLDEALSPSSAWAISVVPMRTALQHIDQNCYKCHLSCVARS